MNRTPLIVLVSVLVLGGIKPELGHFTNGFSADILLGNAVMGLLLGAMLERAVRVSA